MITFAAISKGARQTANYAPLAAALLAPASTLYDIPALSQKWYSFNGEDQPDPPASLILSGFSLAISIIANVFLVVRFSVRWAKAWRWATRLSLAGWIVKTIIGVANLITFGATTRNGPGYEYNQAFWCAIVSVVISGIISLLLISHYTLHFTYTPDPDLRFQGRAIITSELLLFALIALNALVFSRIEGWSYLDAIYFSVVSILSIGFGDFQPTHTSTKILLFPYFITGVSLLANQISIIVNATSHRSKTRKLEFRQRYASRVAEREAKQDKNCDDVSEVDILHGEIRRLRKQAEAEEDATEMVELFYSACTLVSFWLLGALIFHFMEGWTYGNALYFNYVFLFTIGYGDYSPQTPVGRTVFIIWALISVPIMTQFVVQTIQTITGHASKVIALATSQKRLERERVQKEFFAPHGSYLEEAIESINETSSPSTSSESTTEDQEEEQEQIEREATEERSEQISVQKDLLFDLLSTASLLEAQARGIIVDNMDKHSHARLLLLADGNVQLYTLKKLGAERQLSKLKKVHETIGESKDVELERVRQYRKTYAKLLAMGSKLMQFEGDQLSAYQRRESVKDG